MFNNKRENDELKKLREELEEIKRQMSSLKPQPEPIEPNREENDEVEIDDVKPAKPEDVESSERSREQRTWRRYRDNRDWDSWGESLGEYIGTFVEDVMEGVGAEIERSLFVDPHIRHRHRERRREPMDTKAAAEAMSALGNEHRIKILEELSFGGHYANELQESLSEISASTLSSHLDILQESGLIVQERRRGRYLITIPGRLAVKMAYQIADRIDRSREFR